MERLQWEKTKLKNKWRGYFQKLFDELNKWDKDVESWIVEGAEEDISEKEVRSGFKKFMRGKAAWRTDVVVEMVEAAGKLRVKWMTELYRMIHYMSKSVWTRASQTSHSKIMGINMELFPLLLQQQPPLFWESFTQDVGTLLRGIASILQ